MVETLLRAAELEIGERGLDELTTNHVAARAGVGVGSLYQYFADKESIVEALMQRRRAEVRAKARQRKEGAGVGSARAKGRRTRARHRAGEETQIASGDFSEERPRFALSSHRRPDDRSRDCLVV
jgi:AcrR family transcriptional regulator